MPSRTFVPHQRGRTSSRQNSRSARVNARTPCSCGRTPLVTQGHYSTNGMTHLCYSAALHGFWLLVRNFLPRCTTQQERRGDIPRRSCCHIWSTNQRIRTLRCLAFPESRESPGYLAHLESHRQPGMHRHQEFRESPVYQPCLEYQASRQRPAKHRCLGYPESPVCQEYPESREYPGWASVSDRKRGWSENRAPTRQSQTPGLRHLPQPIVAIASFTHLSAWTQSATGVTHVPDYQSVQPGYTAQNGHGSRWWE